MTFEEYEARSLAEDIGLEQELAEAGLTEMPRELGVIEGEILFYKQVAGGAVLEIGRRLIEAKEQLRHGEWEAWLEEKVGFSTRSAQRYMRLAEGYGENDTVTLLGTRKALALLGLSDSDRSEFLEENDAESMTARELEEAVRERNEARLAAEQALADKQVAEAGKEKLEAEMVIANSRIKAADAEAEKLRREIRKLQDRPVEVAVQVDEKAVEKARQEGEAAGRKAAEAKAADAAGKVDKAMKDLRQRLEKAERESRDARAEAEGLQKKLEAAGGQNDEEVARLKKALAVADPYTAAFRVRFEAWQEACERMCEALEQVRAADPEKAKKLAGAVLAVAGMVKEQMEGDNE